MTWLKKKEELRKGAGAGVNMGGDTHATNTGWKPVPQNMTLPIRRGQSGVTRGALWFFLRGRWRDCRIRGR